MYTKQFLVCFLGIILICTAHSRAGVPPAEDTFNHYLDQALSFAKAYPREKAYLHFDNTSYYVGDTIWFKAYVTLSEELLPTPISRPLYVELADQTGHIVEKQIIKITDGEGHGQFILPASSILSGYYEIRAFTAGCWDLMSRHISRELFLSTSPQREKNRNAALPLIN